MPYLNVITQEVRILYWRFENQKCMESNSAISVEPMHSGWVKLQLTLWYHIHAVNQCPSSEVSLNFGAFNNFVDGILELFDHPALVDKQSK